MLISLHNRNPAVLQGGDILFRVLLFFAIFLPLEKSFSLDAKKKKDKKNYLIFSVFTIGLIFQIIFFYLFTAFLKTGSEWWPDGTAIYYALSIDQFTTHFGYFVYQFPLFMKFLTLPNSLMDFIFSTKEASSLLYTNSVFLKTVGL